MNLIKINLNQTVSKAQLEELKEEQKRWVLFGVICFLFLASFTWIYLINSRLNYIVEKRENIIEEIQFKTKELTNKGKINLSKFPSK